MTIPLDVFWQKNHNYINIVGFCSNYIGRERTNEKKDYF